MPTGYTAMIEDDENCTFEAYLWKCAESFLYDRSMPEKFIPEPYYEKKMTEARIELADLQALTFAEASTLAKEQFDDEMRGWMASSRRNVAIAERYEKMRAKAEAWAPPTPDHEWLRVFMISQIELCTEHRASPEDRDRWKPQERTAKEWLQRSISRCEEDVRYYTEEWRKECAKCDMNNAWLAALKKAVPMPVK